MSIVPTVGRKVWYRPGPRDIAGGEHPIPQIDGNQPLDATIVGVLDADTNRINLAVMGADGTGPYPRVDVLLAQDAPPEPGQCAWMPFQKNQAASADKAAAPIDTTAVHQALEAKGKEIHGLLISVEERIKGFLGEEHGKLVAAATHVENVVKQAMAAQAPPPTDPASQG